MLTTRDWVAFVKHMGGRDEYSEEELAKIEADFNALYPRPFTSVTRFRVTDLGGGIKQEARAYWGGGRYLFFYAIMHERDNDLERFLTVGVITAQRKKKSGQQVP